MMIALHRRLAAQASAIAALCGVLASCSSGTSTSAGGAGSDAGEASCKATHPASQVASQPCCLEWGTDACGAGLFCGAFDGRTQATCYPDRSRLGGESCSESRQCLSNVCDATQVCKGVPGGKCTPSIGCGTGLDSETAHYCAAASGGGICRPCTPGSREPECGGTSADGGSSPNDSGSSPGVCVGSCKTNAECQNSCPPLPNGSMCCDRVTGACFGSKSGACPGG